MASPKQIAVIAAIGIGAYAYWIGGTATAATVVGGDLNPSTVPAAYVTDIEKAGAICPGISAALIAAQINQESGFDPRSESDTSAEGIAQFEPYNGMVLDGEVNPWDPASAIPGMAKLDCKELEHWGSVTLALAAYNAGDGGAPHWCSIGQTRNYVESIEAAVPHYTAKQPTKTITTTTAAPTGINRELNGLKQLIGEL